MKFIVIAGLPGTGKSRLAEAVGRELHVPVFAKDWLEAALRRSQWGEATGYAGYELLTTLAERQLHLGQSVILDSVASVERIRSRWRRLSDVYGADWRVVECVCSDPVLQRRRIETRQRGIPDWPELTWADVAKVRSYYEAWQEERLVVDGVRPFPENCRAVLTYVQGTHGVAGSG